MKKRIDVAILATDGCIGSTVHGLLDAFACANACAAERTPPAAPFAVRVVSPGGTPVSSYNGRQIEVDGEIAAAVGADIILFAPIMPSTLPAGAIAARLDALRALLPWLRAQSAAGSCIATSCTGSFLLAETGLLDGKVATTHWRAAQAFRERYPQVVLRESELITEDGNLVCSGGAVSYIDLAIHLVRRFADPALALHCARMLVFDPGRDRQSPYLAFEPRKTHGDQSVLKAQEWLERNYWREISVEAMADRLGMSSRNFKRRFKAACGEPMTNYLQRTRIAAACDRLVASDVPIQRIIFDVGYSDASSFGRLFKETTGVTMGEYRKRFQPGAAERQPSSATDSAAEPALRH